MVSPFKNAIEIKRLMAWCAGHGIDLRIAKIAAFYERMSHGETQETAERNVDEVCNGYFKIKRSLRNSGFWREHVVFDYLLELTLYAQPSGVHPDYPHDSVIGKTIQLLSEPGR